MSDTAQASDLASALTPPGRNIAATTKRTLPDGKRTTIGRKLKAALDLMVWEGTPWTEAAKTVGFHVASMRRALERSHVRQYLDEQKRVFRAQACARNFHRAVELRDQDENRTAAVQAIKLLEGEEPSVNINVDLKAGFVIDISERQPMRDVTPMTDDSEQ